MPLQNPSMFPGQDEENLCNYMYFCQIIFFNLVIYNYYNSNFL